MTTAVTRPLVLAAEAWRQRRAGHEQRVDALVGKDLHRRRSGIKHPVAYFLFTYYSYRPGQLRRWHPGAGAVLEGADPSDLGHGYVARARGVTLDVTGVYKRRGAAIARIRQLLEVTASRTPHFGCFGLHEWAMVYGQNPDEVRHRDWPLRLDPAPVLAQNRVRCSHFDAFRFFTPAARPLNLLQPTRESQLANEQPGCLHANMDLYKHSYKLSPLVPSELVADCFELARDIRTLDMRASPYDLTALSYSPVRIETIEGRNEYVQAQRSFAERAAPLRTRLMAECDRLLAASDR